MFMIVKKLPLYNYKLQLDEGQTERYLQNIFASARSNSPSIIVIDELDILVPRRSNPNLGGK